MFVYQLLASFFVRWGAASRYIYLLLGFAALVGGCGARQERTGEQPQPTATTTGIEMVAVPAGSFEMGSANQDEPDQRLHKIYVCAFSIDKYPLTQEAYEKLIGNNPSLWKGEKPLNQWGLSDMVGNVWEWCNDWYQEDYYQHSPERDPRGPASYDNKMPSAMSYGALPGPNDEQNAANVVQYTDMYAGVPKDLNLANPRVFWCPSDRFNYLTNKPNGSIDTVNSYRSYRFRFVIWYNTVHFPHLKASDLFKPVAQIVYHGGA